MKCKKFLYTLATGLLLLIGMNAHASEFVWAESAGGSSFDSGNGIALDGDGNSYVTGVFQETTSFGGTPLTSNGSGDMFIAKYDPDGTLIWAKSAGGTSLDVGRGIAVDSDGNSYITGHFFFSANFGDTTLTADGGNNIFIVKYDPDGMLIWAKSGEGNGNLDGRSIVVDDSRNSYVTGDFFGTAIFGNTTFISSGSTDILIAKYDPDGMLIWAKSAGGISSDQGNGIAVDGDGNSYITGFFGEIVSFGDTTLTSSGSLDILIAKYSPDGTLIWAKNAGGTFRDDSKGIAVDDDGNSHVTGFFDGTASFGDTTLTSNGSREFFIAKYDSTGMLIEVQRAGGTGSHEGNAIALDGDGNSYITGKYQGEASFGDTTLTSNGNGSTDIFIVKLAAVAPNPVIGAPTNLSGTGCPPDADSIQSYLIPGLETLVFTQHDVGKAGGLVAESGETWKSSCNFTLPISKPPGKIINHISLQWGGTSEGIPPNLDASTCLMETRPAHGKPGNLIMVRKHLLR